MDGEKKPKKSSKIVDIIAIVVLLLLPGIRGYENWRLHEYIPIVVSIVLIVCTWIKPEWREKLVG